MRQLDPATAGFGQLVILDAQADIGSLTDQAILDLSRYTGIYRRLDGYEMSGAGPAVLLADEDNKANIFESPVSLTGGTLSQWVSTLAAWTGLTLGTAAAPGTHTASFRWVTPREALAEVCAHFGAEWRITPDLRIHAGAPSAIYGSTPALIVLGDDEGGRDQELSGVRGTAGRSVDVEDFADKVVYLTDRDNGIYATVTRPQPFRDPMGRPLILDRLVEASVDQGDPNALAAAELGKLGVRRAWDVATGYVDVTAIAPVGSPIWLWSPDDNLYDMTRQVAFRGRTLFPQLDRMVGCTWPIQAGMGVYLRQKASLTAAASYLDLSPYVVPDSAGSAQIEVGAPPRASH